MKKFFLLALFSLFASCDNVQYLDFSSGDIQGKVIWKKGPSLNEENKFVLYLWDSSNGTEEKPVLSQDAQIQVLAWMPGCGPRGGHPSAPVSLKRLSEGVYEVTQLYFTMKGHWDLIFKVTLKEQLQIAQLSIALKD